MRTSEKLRLRSCDCGATFFKKLRTCDCGCASFKLRSCDCGLKKKLRVPTSVNHMHKFPYSYHMRPTLFYTYTILWAYDTLHIHIYELRFLSSFFLLITRQVSWLRPLMSGTQTVSPNCTCPAHSACLDYNCQKLGNKSDEAMKR